MPYFLREAWNRAATKNVGDDWRWQLKDEGIQEVLSNERWLTRLVSISTSFPASWARLAEEARRAKPWGRIQFHFSSRRKFRFVVQRKISSWRKLKLLLRGRKVFLQSEKNEQTHAFSHRSHFHRSSAKKSEELIDGERSYGLSKVLQPVPSEIDTNWTN